MPHGSNHRLGPHPRSRAHTAGNCATLLVASQFLLASASSGGTLAGTIADSTTQAAVEGVRVEVVSAAGALAGRSLSDASGRFRVGPLSAGDYNIVASRIGYERLRIGPIHMSDADSETVAIRLSPGALLLNPVVVTASRRHEKSLDAPASVSVVGRQTIEQTASVSPVAHVRALAGVDVAAKGLTQYSVVARGFSSAQSSALLTLVDYRQASVPSLRYNVYNFVPTPSEDMERIEVVRGPGAALYGPNSDRGVLHILTRSPFDAAGTTVSITGGERGVIQGALRYAGVLRDRLGYKVSARYLRGRDWQFLDPKEVANRDTSIVHGRQREIESIGGEASVDWRAGSGWTLTAASGLNQAVRNVDLSALGAIQVDGWRSTYVQVRAQQKRLFAQAYLNSSDAGDTYFLRSGRPIVDESRLWVGQIQHGVDVGSRQRFTYGFDAQKTEPRTGGTIDGRNEGMDVIQEYGAYLHSETKIRPTVDLVTAVRTDYHNRFQNLVFSPRAAVVWKPTEAHNIRLTYNRAYGTPASDDLFADLVLDSLPLPFKVRVEGVPKSGFTYRRDCGGACMRSPFTSDQGAQPGSYLPADATLMWGAVKAILHDQNMDLPPSAPTPNASQVSTLLGTLNTTTNGFDPVSGVEDIPALQPTITNTAEIGYRGLLGSRIRVAVDGYRTWIEDFVGHLHVITPNVFLEKSSLEAYLLNYMSADSAAAYASTIAGFPLGTITPQQARDPSDLMLSVRNFGYVALWGVDASATVGVTDRISVTGTYSWVSTDLFRNLDGIADLALDAPGQKGTLSLGYRDPDRGLTGEIRLRASASFPVLSGVYAGIVDSYTLVDVGASLRLPGMAKASLAITAENLLDRKHREFVGVPDIGRFVLAKLTTQI
jgi:outer membrane receptor for ferrienterochelin and colicins